MNMASYNLRVLNAQFLVDVIGELKAPEMTLLLPYAHLAVLGSLWSVPFIWLLPAGSPADFAARAEREKQKAD